MLIQSMYTRTRRIRPGAQRAVLKALQATPASLASAPNVARGTSAGRGQPENLPGPPLGSMAQGHSETSPRCSSRPQPCSPHRAAPGTAVPVVGDAAEGARQLGRSCCPPGPGKSHGPNLPARHYCISAQHLHVKSLPWVNLPPDRGRAEL